IPPRAGGAEPAGVSPPAYLVNVARGEIVDEAALIAALREGRLAGAGLDVNEVEPLPVDSPLWDMPNVLLSPHVAGGGSTGYFMHRELFEQNLARLQAGEPLINESKGAARAGTDRGPRGEPTLPRRPPQSGGPGTQGLGGRD